jgi:hypothetical protein
LQTCDVVTGLVPVISIAKSAALHTIEMAGTNPAMTWVINICRAGLSGRGRATATKRRRFIS